MLCTGTKICRVWSKFSVKNADSTLKFVIQDLPRTCIKEYLNFKLNHYMKYEALHQASGILENPDAVKEYLTILNEFINENLNGVTICCTDEENDNFKIVGISAMKLITLHNMADIDKCYAKVKTNEIVKLYKSFTILNDIYPVSELMKKFGLQRYYEDSLGIAVHAKYRGLGICQHLGTARQIMCKDHNVPMCGSWAISNASQIAGKRIGWETVFKISAEEFSQRLGMTFRDPPKYFKYLIRKT